MNEFVEEFTDAMTAESVDKMRRVARENIERLKQFAAEKKAAPQAAAED